MKARDRVVSALKRSIERRGFPRIVLSLVLAGCALFGLLLSITLLQVGLAHMGLRYLVCFALSYALFLALLRLWALRSGSRVLDHALDVPLPGGAHGAGGGSGFAGGGGRFGGAGASGSWDPASADAVSSPPIVSVSSSGGSGAGEALAGFDLDELWALAIPVALVFGGVLAVGYVVFIAPVLLAEVALDVAIAAGAYRGALRLDPGHWSAGVIRRTWLAAAGLALLVGLVGFTLQAMAPEAHSIGAALAAL